MTFAEIKNINKLVLVDFTAAWCGPCKMMAPVLKEVKQDVGDAVSIIKIDVDQNPAVAQEYQIQSVPTLVLFKEGNPVWRQSGVLPKSSLVQKLNSFR